MKQLGFIIILTCFLNIGNAQTVKKEAPSGFSNQPKATLKVSREYDENGNLIRCDSTLTWSYSNFGKNLFLTDTIFNKFFSNDSLIKREFFKDGFFSDELKRDKIGRAHV